MMDLIDLLSGQNKKPDRAMRIAMLLRHLADMLDEPQDEETNGGAPPDEVRVRTQFTPMP